MVSYTDVTKRMDAEAALERANATLEGRVAGQGPAGWGRRP